MYVDRVFEILGMKFMYTYDFIRADKNIKSRERNKLAKASLNKIFVLLNWNLAGPLTLSLQDLHLELRKV